MKKIFTVLLITAAMLMFSFNASAETATEKSNTTENYFEDQIESSGANGLFDKLPDETDNYLSELGIDGIDYKKLLDVSPRSIISLLLDMVSGKASGPLKASVAVLGMILLCSILEGFKTSFGEKSLGGVFGIVAALCVGTSVIIPITSCVAGACSVIKVSCDFMLVFIPVLAAIIAASGNPTAAVTYNTLVFSVSELISRFSLNFITPFIKIFLAFSIVSSVSPELNMNKMADLFKKAITIALGFCSTVFVGLLTVKGFLAGGADSVTVKTVKYFVGSFVPIIGNSIGEALSSIQSCLVLVKSTVGIFGIICIALMYLPVLVELILWILSLSVCAACSDVFGLKNVSSVLKAINSALVLLTVIIIFCSILLIVSTAIMLMIRNG